MAPKKKVTTTAAASGSGTISNNTASTSAAGAGASTSAATTTADADASIDPDQFASGAGALDMGIDQFELPKSVVMKLAKEEVSTFWEKESVEERHETVASQMYLGGTDLSR